MKLIVNNDERHERDGITVAELLDRAGMRDRPCAVEVNRTLVPKRRHADHVLQEGDRIEIVTLVGGG